MTREPMASVHRPSDSFLTRSDFCKPLDFVRESSPSFSEFPVGRCEIKRRTISKPIGFPPHETATPRPLRRFEFVPLFGVESVLHRPPALIAVIVIIADRGVPVAVRYQVTGDRPRTAKVGRADLWNLELP